MCNAVISKAVPGFRFKVDCFMCCSASSQDVCTLASSLLDDYFSKDVLDEQVLRDQG
jgi:hypothetical protein